MSAVRSSARSRASRPPSATRGEPLTACAASASLAKVRDSLPQPAARFEALSPRGAAATSRATGSSGRRPSTASRTTGLVSSSRRWKSVPKNHDLLIAASTIWVVVTAVLVMFMQAGFAFLEAGLTRMKNAAHIAGKNVLIFGICSLVYWAVGFGLAFGDGNVLIGPRIGKFGHDGRANPIPGHNMPYAVLGTLILWFGWFGFNPGSTLSVDFGGFGYFGYVALTTNLAAASGALGGILTAWLVLRKPDLSMMLNGVIAALVAITAASGYVPPGAAIVIGLVSGFIAVVGVIFV